MDFAIDFDQTVAIDMHPEVGPPVPGAIKALKTLVDQGHRLILFTMRHNEGLTKAVDFFKENNIPLFGVQTNPEQIWWTDSPKCDCDYFIDDKALGIPLINDPAYEKPYVDWKSVMEFLKSKRIVV